MKKFAYIVLTAAMAGGIAEAGQPEGKGVHMGTSGASNCRDTTGSPSTRAPGKNT